jgi:hypothetical protein
MAGTLNVGYTLLSLAITVDSNNQTSPSAISSLSINLVDRVEKKARKGLSPGDIAGITTSLVVLVFSAGLAWHYNQRKLKAKETQISPVPTPSTSGQPFAYFMDTMTRNSLRRAGAQEPGPPDPPPGPELQIPDDNHVRNFFRSAAQNLSPRSFVSVSLPDEGS